MTNLKGRLIGLPKRLLAGALAALSCLTFGTAALQGVSAAGEGSTAKVDHFQTIGNNYVIQNYITGLPAGSDYAKNQGKVHSKFNIAYINDNGDVKISYCLQYGVDLNSGDSLSSSYYNNLSLDQKELIALAIMFGFNDYSCQDANWRFHQYGWDAALATQIMIWNITNNVFDTSTATAADGTVEGECMHSLSASSNSVPQSVVDVYRALKEMVVKAHTPPSCFGRLPGSAPSYTLEWNAANQRYETTLTDEYGVMDYYDLAADYIGFERSGNTVTAYTTQTGLKDVTCTATCRLKEFAEKNAGGFWSLEPDYWDAGTKQDLVSYHPGSADPVQGYAKFSVKANGSLKLVKTSEDGIVSGISMHVSGNGIEQDVVTGENGEMLVENLPEGTYTVSEYALDRYVEQQSQTVTVQSGETAAVQFSNVLKKFHVTVTKTDAETGSTPQGDSTFAGAIYGLYQNGTLVKSYTTDASGKFTTDYYVCGDNWTIREITPPEGYTLDETVYHVGAEAKLYEVEYNSTSNDVVETVIKGSVAIIKHSDDGSTQIETPEVGATFQIYLKSSGSYEAAKETERDVLVCDEYGFAQSKDLPYGVYTVHQTSGWEGRELLDDFDVYVAKDGQTYRYLINNANFESYVKVVKVDAETGKAIPYAGAGFRIYDEQGNLISMSYTYPTPTTIDTFYTDVNGALVTPEPLEYGSYTLVEVQSPYGYVLNSTPISVEITAENATEENGVTVVAVNVPNTPQKGTITVSKSGEVFSSVSKSGEAEEILYQPVYATKGLAGAAYEITAAEDIITPDGTLRYAKGTVVDTITTGTDSTATSKELYLGKYTVTETKAPYGMVLNTTPVTVELTYAGQEVSVTNTAVGFTNERQKVEINLLKVMEQNERFGIGENGEVKHVTFGLYAAQNIKAADGTVIPKDGLLEVLSCDEYGKAAFTADLPVGAGCYVKEIATDEHYILSDTEYPVTFEYAGQKVAVVNIEVNGGEEIINELFYGSVEGLKVDRETGATIAGATFGLFGKDETAFTEDTALLTAITDDSGVFAFTDLPCGEYVIRELNPADGFLPNDETYPVSIEKAEQVVEITVENDRIPQLHTTATIDGAKNAEIGGNVTITDVVKYEHLVPGKEYTITGVLMNKATGEAFTVDDQQITSTVVFTPDSPSGEVEMQFTFDTSALTANTDLVVFETVYQDDVELAAHADLSDIDQTVMLTMPVPVPKTDDNAIPMTIAFGAMLSAVTLGGLWLLIFIQRQERILHGWGIVD